MNIFNATNRSFRGELPRSDAPRGRFIAPNGVSVAWCAVLSRGAPFYAAAQVFGSTAHVFGSSVRRFMPWCAVRKRGALFYVVVRRFMSWCAEFSKQFSI